TCDFRAHRVVHFKYSEAGAGFQTKEIPDLLRSTNVTFRPIDVKLGPDGALYIADWANPIIQHGEVDFRDPRRDKEHGRIWRVTAKGRPLVKRQDLSKLNLTGLLDRTLSRNGWEQEQARVVLRNQDCGVVPLTFWLSKIWNSVGRKDKDSMPEIRAMKAQLEAAWILSARPETPKHLSGSLGGLDLMDALLSSKDANFRAAGCRLLSHWCEADPESTSKLQTLIADDHPRVRLEALRALARIPSAKSAELAL